MDASMIAVELRASASPLTETQVDAALAWIVATPEQPRWRDVPHGATLGLRHARQAAAAEAWATDLPNRRSTRAVHLPLSEHLSPFELLGAARRAVELALENNPRELVVSLHGCGGQLAAAACEALASAALARSVALPVAKRTPPPASKLARIRLHGRGARIDARRVLAEAEGNGLARQLAALPPNELTPGRYRERVAAVAAERGLRFDFHDLAALRRRSAGAFLAVARGSTGGDAGIAHVSYRPRGARRDTPRVALVGKGLCYDTGGVNLKPARAMFGMHQDMTGSAVALGTLLALQALEVPFIVDAWLALAANHIGPDAYQPNDIVKAADGTSIEIVHTDAEGRLVLADTLLLATAGKPALTIDYATLTGACIHALGKAYSGIFTNRPALLPLLTATGQASGERVWAFPFDADYDKALDSPVADIRQCAPDGEADHILAARFLSRFVQNGTPWIHLDLASANRKGGLAHIASDETGFGVRYTCRLLLEQKVLERLG
jgi:leucyl aminopeptidase